MTTFKGALWNIPYQRNPFFTGREDVLVALRGALQADTTVALSHPQGISGLGGIGKTQTAIEYAYRYRSEYKAVFWVRADSVTALTSSMLDMARVLELPERDEQDQEIIVQAVLRWLRANTNWLLIYDNIDNLSIAEPFLATAGAGHLLFTTRTYALGGLAQRLDIQKMEPEVGALLLLRRASLLTPQATLDIASPDDQRLACAISEELDGLPLALDQAGAYIKEAPCPLQDYLTRYQTRRGDILRERGSFDQDYPASVATTWSLSFEKVSRVDPAAAELLKFCAFLAPDAIPETMILKGALYLPPIVQEVTVHPVRFDQTLAALLAYSLVGRNVNETLNVHRLVQAVLRDGMAVEAQYQWKERAVLVVNVASPNVEDVTQWETCERWLPHAQICAAWIEQENMKLLEAALLLNAAGYYLDERAQYTQAEPLYVRALAIREQQLGAGHIYTAHSLNNLAMLCYHQGKYAQAEQLYIHALQIYEQRWETAHPDIARSLNNLAMLYDSQGKYAQAEPLYQRALAIREQLLGFEHPDTAQSLNNLAMLCYSQGKYAQAESLLERALAIRERLLGTEHPDIAQNLSNLALLYYTQGKYAQAEPLYIRAIAIRERLSEAEHPDTATTLNNLAMLYDTQGRYEEAEPLYIRVLQISEQQMGTEHPDTAQSLNNLALLYYTQGEYEKAEPLYARALSIYEQQLGTVHPDIAVSLNNLAALYQKQGKYEQAEPLYIRALSIYEQKLESDHPDMAGSLNNLAVFYYTQRRYGEAEPLLRRAYFIRMQRLGTDHPETQAMQRNYIALLRALEADDAPS